MANVLGQTAILQCYRVLYRETHVLLDDMAIAEGARKQFMDSLTTVLLLIIDDFGMRKLPLPLLRVFPPCSTSAPIICS